MTPLEKARAAKKEPIHLLRGAPSVRSWSKYQTTDPNWTLCGIRRRGGKGRILCAESTEKAQLVNCPYCHVLMAPSQEKRRVATA